MTFSESGLHPGTNWSVALAGQLEFSTSSTINFTESNGSYQYSLGFVSGYSSAMRSGNLTVHGTSVIESITFTLYKFHVTFSEMGLPLGARWWVVLNGVPKNSTNNAILFLEPNGTFPYSISSVVDLGPSPANGTLLVENSSLLIPVAYAQVYALVFSETTLPSGTNWTVTLVGDASSVILATPIGGVTTSVTRWSDGGSKIWFYVSNGTYTVWPAAPGYSSQIAPITISGPPSGPATANFTSIPSSSPDLVPLGYALVLVVILSAAIAAAVTVRWRRRQNASRSPRPPPPP